MNHLRILSVQKSHGLCMQQKHIFGLVCQGAGDILLSHICGL